MRIRIVGSPVAVENRHIAEPDARLHIRQRDLLAGDGGGAHAHRTFGAGNPLLRRFAARGDQVAVFESLDVSTSKNVVFKGRGQG